MPKIKLSEPREVQPDDMNPDIEPKLSRPKKSAPPPEPVVVEEEAARDADRITVEESLSEIYQNDDGETGSVQEIIPKKKLGMIFWLPFSFFLISSVLAASWYLVSKAPDIKSGTEMDISIIPSTDSPTDGENFFYTVKYANISRFALKNAEIKVALPSQFLADEFKPVPSLASSTTNITWHFDSLAGFEGGEIRIGGKFYGKIGEKAVIYAEISYTPENFSSEFKKSADNQVVLKDTGLEFAFDNYSSAMIGSDNEVIIRYKAFEGGRLDNFRLTVEALDNPTVGFISKASTSADYEHSAIKPNLWSVKNVSGISKELPVDFIVTEKKSDSLAMKFTFSIVEPGGREFTIEEKTLNFSLLKNDMNLSLVINGSKEDQGVDFGKTMNYSIYYSNKGDSELADVSLQAVIEGGLVKWEGLKDPSGGKLSGNSITWTKEELPALAAVAPNDEGTIDFSVPVKTREEAADAGADEIKSYVHFRLGSSTEEANEVNSSNTIINKINSEMVFSEKARYFDDDNIAVGSGPLPPKVGETTSVKVYWTLLTTIHELENTRVETILPKNIVWNSKELTTVGTISFKEETRTVVWDVGKLPVLPEAIRAEFSISVTPAEEDRNKMLVLISDTEAKASDTITGAEIKKTAKPETTKLEDDEIGKNDGRVE
jgi:hypothetical protein